MKLIPNQVKWLLGIFLASTVALAGTPSQSHQHAAPQTTVQKSQAETLVQVVRDATERFKDVAAAQKEGFALVFGCVSGPDQGAMGLHYLNGDRLNEVNTTGKFYVDRPQIVIYEAAPDGTLHLTGADFLVFADQWDALHPNDPPQLGGQLFHRFDFPNRFALPAFYTLHVWAWKENPNGAFVNWHPNVSCQSFTAQK